MGMTLSFYCLWLSCIPVTWVISSGVLYLATIFLYQCCCDNLYVDVMESSTFLHIALAKREKGARANSPDPLRFFLYMLFCVPLFSTLWTAAHQAPMSVGFIRQDYLNRQSPSPGDLPSPEIESMSLASTALADGFFTTVSPEIPYLLSSSFRDKLSRILYPILNCGVILDSG